MISEWKRRKHEVCSYRYKFINKEWTLNSLSRNLEKISDSQRDKNSEDSLVQRLVEKACNLLGGLRGNV